MIDPKTSQGIYLLKFILMIEVVIIHAKLPSIIREGVDIFYKEGGYSLYETISFILGMIVCESAVPAFFLLSAYLLYSEKGYNLNTYEVKVKSRFRSIVIPYIAWNLITILAFL